MLPVSRADVTSLAGLTSGHQTRQTRINAPPLATGWLMPAQFSADLRRALAANRTAF